MCVTIWALSNYFLNFKRHKFLCWIFWYCHNKNFVNNYVLSPFDYCQIRLTGFIFTIWLLSQFVFIINLCFITICLNTIYVLPHFVFHHFLSFISGCVSSKFVGRSIGMHPHIQSSSQLVFHLTMCFVIFFVSSHFFPRNILRFINICVSSKFVFDHILCFIALCWYVGRSIGT